MISSSSIVKALTLNLREGEDLSVKLAFFLKKNHLLGLLPSIVRKLEKYDENQKKQNTVFVTTSHQFSSDLMDRIEKRVGSFDGKKVERVVDQNIIGGFRIKNGYKIVDGSLRTNLKVLKESLLKTNV